MDGRASSAALALLLCLAWPENGGALTCPPGQKEVSGRCVPINDHFWRAEPPKDRAKDRIELNDRAAPQANPHPGPAVETGREAGSATPPRHVPIEARPELRPPAVVLPAPPPPPTVAPSTATVAPAPATAASSPAAGKGARRPATASAEPENGQLVPVRAYLRSSEIPPPAIGAYGVVAFRARPTAATRSRLLMACTAYVASIPAQKSIPGTVPIFDQMLTIWPLDEPSSPRAAKDDCDFAIDHYDLYGGDSAIADAERQGVKFGEDGPFLIGWSPSNTRGVPDKFVLLIDMSSFTSQDSFDHAFQLWKQKIVEDPSLWRNGFSIEGIRLAVRDFADGYGDTILKAAVSIWKK